MRGPQTCGRTYRWATQRRLNDPIGKLLFRIPPRHEQAQVCKKDLPINSTQVRGFRIAKECNLGFMAIHLFWDSLMQQKCFMGVIPSCYRLLKPQTMISDVGESIVWWLNGTKRNHDEHTRKNWAPKSCGANIFDTEALLVFVQREYWSNRKNEDDSN